MSDHLYEDKRAYRNALCRLSNELRLQIELDLLCEMHQTVVQAQRNFDGLGGQSRMDSINLVLSEIRGQND
jgi:hypothetical protein